MLNCLLTEEFSAVWETAVPCCKWSIYNCNYNVRKLQLQCESCSLNCAVKSCNITFHVGNCGFICASIVNSVHLKYIIFGLLFFFFEMPVRKLQIQSEVSRTDLNLKVVEVEFQSNLGMEILTPHKSVVDSSLHGMLAWKELRNSSFPKEY